MEKLCRDVLAKISTITNNGKQAYWRIKANEVSEKMKSYLWILEKRLISIGAGKINW